MNNVKAVMRLSVRILALLVFVSLIAGMAFAEDVQESDDPWYPYDIKITDGYTDVWWKISEALSGQPQNSREKYVQYLPVSYYLYDLPVSEFVVMDQQNYWRISFSANVPQTETDLENIYSFYSALVDKLGEPLESSPTEIHATFDGEEKINILASKDSFLSSAIKADYGTKYRAKFEHLEFEVNIWEKVQVIVTFDNELVAKDESTTERIGDDQTGDIIIFGRYPQTEEGTDQTPIEWIVLDVQGSNALVISKYGLDKKSYNMDNVDYLKWENCTLRNWLNGEFLQTAFSAEEQAGIITTTVDNSDSQGYSKWMPDGGNNTQDQVFLLSYAEANRYFGLLSEDKDNVKARVSPTAYAASKRHKSENIAEIGWWWLRSHGSYPFSLACVDYDGSLKEQNDYNEGCVRPALWINLESEILKSENPQY